MNKLFIILLSVTTLFISCKQEVQEYSLLKKTEIRVRQDHDHSAVYTYDQYRTLMQTINTKGCIAMTMYDFKDYSDNSKILIGMRHDVDRHPFKGLEMAVIEKEYHINTSYYLLATDDYYGYFDDNNNFIRNYCMMDLYKDIYDMGHEIGVHNDLLSIMLGWNKDPKIFNANELQYFNYYGIPIYGSVAHGSDIVRATCKANYEVFEEFNSADSVSFNGKNFPLGIDSMKNFGFEYEGYYIGYNKFIHDVGGKWTYIEYEKHSGPGKSRPSDIEDYTKSNGDVVCNRKNDISFDEVIQIINEAVPGDRIVILTHPVWWGKKMTQESL